MESTEELGTSVPCLTHTGALITAYQEELAFPLVRNQYMRNETFIQQEISQNKEEWTSATVTAWDTS